MVIKTDFEGFDKCPDCQIDPLLMDKDIQTGVNRFKRNC